MVWCKGSTSEHVLAKARGLSAGIAKQKGVFWNRVGEWGIRLSQSEHEAGLRELKPEFKNTPYVDARTFWKIVNLPRGCDKATIQKYIDAAKWKAIPFTPMGPRTWRVGAEGPPPADVWQIDPNDPSQRTLSMHPRDKRRKPSSLPNLHRSSSDGQLPMVQEVEGTGNPHYTTKKEPS